MYIFPVEKNKRKDKTMKKILNKTSKTLLALILPILLFGEINLTDRDGTIQGKGYAKSHDFPLVAQMFSITISDIEDNKRTLSFTLPVGELTTENFMRDKHMASAMFKRKEYPNIVYTGETDFINLTEGSFVLRGEVQINGKSEMLDIPLTIERSESDYVAKGSFSLQPTLFDMPLVGMGPMKLQDNVDLTIEFKLPVE